MEPLVAALPADDPLAAPPRSRVVLAHRADTPDQLADAVAAALADAHGARADDSVGAYPAPAAPVGNPRAARRGTDPAALAGVEASRSA
ncbi:hypothetical protein ACFCV9_22120 [Streptomyces sp. NPDC056367]|uniref:hypothetical protein n=1 Tax=Streptomyces sp. NPDC056367 TaxID=3345797 RepID=UPI0035DC7F29